MSPSAVVRLEIRLAAGELDHVSREFWRHRRVAELFPEYYFTLWSSMRATVPMMEVAAACARELAESDPVAAGLVAYYEQHAREELHHDEWLLEDMEVLGLQRKDVIERLPPREVAAMVGSQYYWMRHAHPVALLGCFAVLEGQPVTVALLDDLVARTTIPRAALRTLYKHAELDPNHRDDLDQLLDRLPLTKRHTALVGLSAIDCCGQLVRVIERFAGGVRAPEGMG